MTRDGPSDATAEAIWRFAIEFYDRPGVAADLLSLQDKSGADVLLLLYGLWCGTEGVALDTASAHEAVALSTPWRVAAIRPLRNIRRTLKSGVSGVPSSRAESLRAAVAALELDAERLGLEVLAAAPRPQVKATKDVAALALTNLRTLLSADGVTPEDEVTTVLERLVQTVQSGSDGRFS